MKTVTIEALLTWAFTRELCKGGVEGGGEGGRWAQVWRSMGEMAELGLLVDRSPNAFGVIPDFSPDEGRPHADAVMVGEAVRALAQARFAVPGAPLFPGLDDPHGLIAGEEARAREALRRRGDADNARHVVMIVINAAVLGRGPDIALEQPRFRMMQKYGKPAWFVQRKARDTFGNVYRFEDEGYDARAKRPRRGAYRKWELAEPLIGAALARIDRLWWREALARLHAGLEGRLAAHRLVCSAPTDSGVVARMAGESASV